MFSISIIAISIICVVAILGVIMFILNSYKICPNDKIMVIHGMNKKTENGLNFSYIHGGGKLVIPFFQKAVYMSLKPKTIEVSLNGALTNNSIRVDVPSQFTTRIGYQDSSTLQNAVNNLLESSEEDIINHCKEIILGSLREIVSRMSIEELISDREKFIKLVDSNTNKELRKIGIEIVNVNIRDIIDESGYIDAIGKKAAASAVEKAKIDVAEQEKSGAIGVANNDREKAIKTSEHLAEQVKGENDAKANIEKSNSELGIKSAEYKRDNEIANAEADRLVYIRQQETRRAELEKETIPTAEVEKRKIQINADADAEQIRIKAQGDADAYRLDADAKAHGIKVEFEAKAKGLEELVKAANGNENAALKYLVVEKMEELAKLHTEAVKAIDFSNITFWGGGSGNGSNSMSNAVQDLWASVSPLHGLLAQVGVELPNFMGKTVDGKVVTEDKENPDNKEEKE